MSKWIPARRTPLRASALNLVAGTALSLLMLPAFALAQQGWDVPSAIGLGGGTPAVAVDHLGNSVVAWLADAGSGVVVRVRRRSAAAATWGVPVDLSAPAATPPGNPIAAVDAAGNVHVLWVDGGISSSRYSAATDSWGAAVVIAPTPSTPDCTLSSDVRVALDPVGRAFVVWVLSCRDPVGFLVYTHTVHAARYEPDTGIVNVTTLSAPATGANVVADVSVDELGNATVLWPRPGPAYVMQAAAYTATTGAWSAPTSVLPNPYDAFVDGVRMASDAQGHVIAVWRVTDARSCVAIRVARYDALSRAWEHMADLGAVTSPLWVQLPGVAVDSAGQAVVIWEEVAPPMRQLRAATYRAATGAWSPALDLSPADNSSPGASIATDALGNVTAVWSERFAPSPTGYKIRGARLTSSGVATITNLSTSGGYTSPAALAVGAGGHVTVAWSCCLYRGVPSSVAIVQWRPSPTAPAITGIAPGDGTLSVAFSPPAAAEPAFGAIYYEASTDGGVTWTMPVPPSAVSPIRIAGLTNGVAYAIRVRAINVAGPGAASFIVMGTPLPAPEAPTALRVAAQSGRRVTLEWRPPGGGVPTTGYVIQAGTAPGAVEASLPVASGLPVLTIDVPPGAFYVRVHAVAGPSWSPPSNEIRIFVDLPLRPSPPRDLLRLVNGSSVSVSWRNTFEQGAPTGVVLEVSSAQGSSRIRLPLVETFQFAGVPSGDYQVAIRAINEAGESDFGSAVAVEVPASCAGTTQGAPHVPKDFVAGTSGRAYYLAWAPPQAGPAIESYVIEVSGSDTFTATTTSRALSGVASPGTYTISILARNSCGTGPATAPTTVVIP